MAYNYMQLWRLIFAYHSLLLYLKLQFDGQNMGDWSDTAIDDISIRTARCEPYEFFPDKAKPGTFLAYLYIS